MLDTDGHAATNGGWESLFWMIFERSVNPMLLLDEQRRFVEVNAPTLEMLGYTRGALLGRTITDIIKEGERAESWDRWREFLGSGEYSGRRTFVRSDGNEVEVEFAARLAEIGGRRLAVFVWTRDIDPKHHRQMRTAEAELLTPREREIVTLIALGRDTAGIAEELTISRETVRTHVRNAMRKLGVHTRTQLVVKPLCLAAALDDVPRVG